MLRIQGYMPRVEHKRARTQITLTLAAKANLVQRRTQDPLAVNYANTSCSLSFSMRFNEWAHQNGNIRLPEQKDVIRGLSVKVTYASFLHGNWQSILGFGNKAQLLAKCHCPHFATLVSISQKVRFFLFFWNKVQETQAHHFTFRVVRKKKD